jgi:respiratory burst oxidase
MDNLDFAGDLFDGLARRHGISADCVNKLELREFWEQVSDQGLDGRLQTIIDR